MFVVGCKVFHFKVCWMFGSTWLQNPKAYKNAIASLRIYEFSNLSICVFDDFKIKLLYALGV